MTWLIRAATIISVLWAGDAVAQPRPGAFTTVTLTDTSSTALRVGCPVGSGACTGGIIGGPGDLSSLVLGGPITIASLVPPDTSLKLYNSSGTLFWNGVSLATGGSVSGTTGTIGKFTSSSSIGNSIMTESGTTVTVAGTLSATTLTGTLSTANQPNVTGLGTIATGTWQATKVGLTYGGTNADLSATGGTSQFLRQNTVGGTVTVVRPAAADLSDAANVAMLPEAETVSGAWTFSAAGTAVSVTNTLSAGLFSGSGASLTSLNATNVSSGTLDVQRGGTGLGSYTVGDILYATGVTTIGRLAAVASGQLLVSQGVGTAPSYSDKLVVSGSGPHAIGGATNSNIQLLLTGNFSSGEAHGLNINGTYASADSGNSSGLLVTPTFVEAASGIHPNFIGSWFRVPTITAGVASVENTATVKIDGAMSAGSKNYALWVQSGTVKLSHVTFDPTVSGKVEWPFNYHSIFNNAAAINNYEFQIVGVSKLFIDTNQLVMSDGVAAGLARLSTSTTNPVFNVAGDNDTGMGRSAADEWSVYTAGVQRAKWDASGHYLPGADNTYNNGNGTFRWALIRGVTITSGDYLLENGFALTEHYKMGITTHGIAIVNAHNKLIAFIDEAGSFYTRRTRSLDELSWVPNPPAVRATMEEERVH